MRYSKGFKITTSVLALQLAMPAIAPSSLSASWTLLTEMIKNAKSFSQVEAEFVAQPQVNGLVDPDVLKDKVNNIQTAKSLIPNGGVEFIEEQNLYPDWEGEQLIQNLQHKSRARAQLILLGRNQNNLDQIAATVRCMVAHIAAPLDNEVDAALAYIGEGHKKPSQREIRGWARSPQSRQAREYLAHNKLDAADNDLVNAAAALLTHAPNIAAGVIKEIAREHDPARYQARIRLATVGMDALLENNILSAEAFINNRILNATAGEISVWIATPAADKDNYIWVVSQLRVLGLTNITSVEATDYFTSTNRALEARKIKAKRAFATVGVTVADLTDIEIDAWVDPNANATRKTCITQAARDFRSAGIADPSSAEIDHYVRTPNRRNAVRDVVMGRDFHGVRYPFTRNETDAWDTAPTRAQQQAVGRAVHAFRIAVVTDATVSEIHTWIHTPDAQRADIIAAVQAFRPTTVGVTAQEITAWTAAQAVNRPAIVTAARSLRVALVNGATVAEINDYAAAGDKAVAIGQINAKRAFTASGNNILDPTAPEIDAWVASHIAAEKADVILAAKAFRALPRFNATFEELVAWVLNAGGDRNAIVAAVQALRVSCADANREEINHYVAARDKALAIGQINAKRAFANVAIAAPRDAEINIWIKMPAADKDQAIAAVRAFRAARIASATLSEMIAWVNMAEAQRPEVIQAVQALRNGKPNILGIHLTRLNNLAITEINAWVAAPAGDKAEVVAAVDAFRGHRMDRVTADEINEWRLAVGDPAKTTTIENIKAKRAFAAPGNNILNPTAPEINAWKRATAPNKGQIIAAVQVLRAVPLLNLTEAEVSAYANEADKAVILAGIRELRLIDGIVNTSEVEFHAYTIALNKIDAINTIRTARGMGTR